MKIVYFAILLTTFSFSAIATECSYKALGPGPVKLLNTQNGVTQVVQFNHDLKNPSCPPLQNSTRGQLFFSRSSSGECHLSSISHLRSGKQAWIRVNEVEITRDLTREYRYGVEYHLKFDCPARGPLEVQFAFTVGHGEWDNNHDHDYKVKF